jgi:hypothetical protein
MNTKSKESRRLYWIRDRLQEMGMYVILSRGSLGPFDLVAMSKNGVLLIQVKCNSWPDAAEKETLYNFDKCPVGSIKECWRFDDGKKDHQVITY